VDWESKDAKSATLLLQVTRLSFPPIKESTSFIDFSEIPYRRGKVLIAWRCGRFDKGMEEKAYIIYPNGRAA
jgi:hypothetical protein